MNPPLRRHPLDFDIDRYLNHVIPRNRLDVLPKPMSRFLGYRSEPHTEPPAPLQWPVTFLATVAGLCLVAGVTNYIPGIAQLHPPVLIPSLGASAVLDYNAMRSPLAQPRNTIVGNVLSAAIGVGIAQLFLLAPAFFAQYPWLPAAVACGLASVAMSATNTVHPPGGATAVIASIEPQARAMGWWFVPLVLLSSVLMIATALVFNNIFRQYPIYWWTPSAVGGQLRADRAKQANTELQVAEEGLSTKRDSSDWSSEGVDEKSIDGSAKGGDPGAEKSPPPIQTRIPSWMEFREEMSDSLDRTWEGYGSAATNPSADSREPP